MLLTPNVWTVVYNSNTQDSLAHIILKGNIVVWLYEQKCVWNCLFSLQHICWSDANCIDGLQMKVWDVCGRSGVWLRLIWLSVQLVSRWKSLAAVDLWCWIVYRPSARYWAPCNQLRVSKWQMKGLRWVKPGDLPHGILGIQARL